MKKILISAAVISALSLTANAQSNNKSGVYVSGKIGTSIMQMSGQRLDYLDRFDPTENSSLHLGKKNKGVFSGGVAVGYDFFQDSGIPVRAEIDLTIRGKAKTNKHVGSSYLLNTPEHYYAGNNLELTTLMLNGYYDFHNSTSFTPYISAGLGYARVKFDTKASAHQTNPLSYENFSMSKHSNKFAWSLGAGVQYAMTDDLSLDLGYRFVDAGKFKMGTHDHTGSFNSRSKVRSNDIYLGITYRF